jgi:hypothetical protein
MAERQLPHPKLMRALDYSIGNCSGMPIREKFHYVSEKGKDGSSTNLVTAMIKYGTTNGRVPHSLTDDEKVYLQTALDPTLMRLLHYPPISFDDGKENISNSG